MCVFSIFFLLSPVKDFNFVDLREPSFALFCSAAHSIACLFAFSFSIFDLHDHLNYAHPLLILGLVC